jgi:hypothetical protein
MGTFQQMHLINTLVGMGFSRNLVEALMRESREPLQNANQAIDAFYDPLLHNAFAGNDVVDEVS